MSNSSPRACVRTSPYTGSSRVSSRSDDLLAVSRNQHQFLPVNDSGGTLAPASHTQSSRPLELMSSTAKVDASSFSPLRQTIFLDSYFDSSSFDFALAFAEASYSAQATGATNPRSTLQLNSLPIGPCELFSPDLFASLNVPPLPPPPSDESRHQLLRFPTDLYTPQFVRNHGIEREGWCGLCRPGRWLVLKNSAFWYDKIFMHGISAASGTRFETPVGMRKTAGKVHGEGEGKGVGAGDGWDGLCGTCGVWKLPDPPDPKCCRMNPIPSHPQLLLL